MRRCTACYICLPCGIFTDFDRDKLREQHQLSEEIGAAITSVPLGEQPDEDELDQELEGLEQEAMDERMLHTGPVPVNPQLDRLPEAGQSECMFNLFLEFYPGTC